MSIFSREVPRDADNNLAPQPYSTHRPLTAAAARIDVSNKKEIESLKKKREADDWQTQAWEFYDLVGELKYSSNLIAAVTSRIKLYPAYITDNNLTPSHLQDIDDIDKDLVRDAKRAIRLLGSGNGGIPGLLRDAALNLFITGECWLVQTPANAFTKEAETWQIRSVDELVFTTGRNGGIRLKTRRDSKATQQKEVPAKAFVGRIWNMHPRYSDEADSSVRGILELLDELLLLNKAARASIKSRLNAGILFLPDVLTDASQSDGEITGEEGFADGSDDETDSFEEELIYAMTTPISDEGSAASLVPLVVRGPDSAADKIKHITLARPFDAHHNERAEKVLDRILGSLDIPKEVVAGISDSKYSNAVVIEETLYKSHIEPLALLLVDTFTTVFFKPVLRALGYTDDQIERVVLWYDPSAITTKPSKAEAADSGYNSHIISATAWRRAHGFSDTDGPTELETGQRLAVERGLLSEQVTEALLTTLMPELMSSVREMTMNQSPGGQALHEAIGGTPIPSENEHEPIVEIPPGLIEPDGD